MGGQGSRSDREWDSTKNLTTPWKNTFFQWSYLAMGVVCAQFSHLSNGDSHLPGLCWEINQRRYGIAPSTALKCSRYLINDSFHPFTLGLNQPCGMENIIDCPYYIYQEVQVRQGCWSSWWPAQYYANRGIITIQMMVIHDNHYNEMWPGGQ